MIKKTFPDLAKNICSLRLEAGLSQAELGKKIGYSQQIINAYENGQRMPPAITLQLLADLFNTTVDGLLGKKNLRDDTTPMPSRKIMKKLRAVAALSPKAQKQVVDYIDLLLKTDSK